MLYFILVQIVAAQEGWLIMAMAIIGGDGQALQFGKIRRLFQGETGFRHGDLSYPLHFGCTAVPDFIVQHPGDILDLFLQAARVVEERVARQPAVPSFNADCPQVQQVEALVHPRFVDVENIFVDFGTGQVLDNLGAGLGNQLLDIIFGNGVMR